MVRGVRTLYQTVCNADVKSKLQLIWVGGLVNILNKPHNSFDIVLNLQPLEYSGFFVTQKTGGFLCKKIYVERY